MNNVLKEEAEEAKKQSARARISQYIQARLQRPFKLGQGRGEEESKGLSLGVGDMNWL